MKDISPLLLCCLSFPSAQATPTHLSNREDTPHFQRLRRVASGQRQLQLDFSSLFGGGKTGNATLNVLGTPSTTAPAPGGDKQSSSSTSDPLHLPPLSLPWVTPTKAPTRRPTARPSNSSTSGGKKPTTSPVGGDKGSVDSGKHEGVQDATPLPTPVEGGPPLVGKAPPRMKSFDWGPIVYASVATGILVIVLITVAIVIRVVRVHQILSPSSIIAGRRRDSNASSIMTPGSAMSPEGSDVVSPSDGGSSVASTPLSPGGEASSIHLDPSVRKGHGLMAKWSAGE